MAFSAHSNRSLALNTTSASITHARTSARCHCSSFNTVTGEQKQHLEAAHAAHIQCKNCTGGYRGLKTSTMAHDMVPERSDNENEEKGAREGEQEGDKECLSQAQVLLAREAMILNGLSRSN
ncbi:MAG: hypothetical protein GY820_20915 [Gammaproteobacteria bacterium]|nr:hypothetical protein [Gammaproteobacteria bacterium]